MRKVGILGGGQLGRMMALAGYPLDIACRLWDPAPDACAGQVTELLHAPYSDPNALVHFIEGLECATFEFENIDLAVAQAVAEHIPVHPTPDALRLFQDRLLEKQTLRRYGIPTPNFAEVDPAHPERALAEVGLPAVLKTRRFGYDGKGQVVVHTEEQFHEAVAHFAGQPLIVEAFVPFEREVSTIGVRGHSGEFVCYPLIENLHYEGVLRLSIVGSGEWGMGSGTSEGSGQWAVGSGESSLTHPCPPSPEASGEGGSQTPLSHSVGEGSGVRATENLTPPTPLSASREGGVQGGETPSPFTERGQGGEVLSAIPHSPLPTPQTREGLAIRAIHHTHNLMHALDYVGVMTIEWFQVGDTLLANEVAPRVHNSGHWTIEGAETSQFENHLRAILGLPLGATAPRGYSAMVNLIGAIPPPEAVLKIPYTHLHLYGKSPRPGRKVGHITIRTDTPEERTERLIQLLSVLREVLAPFGGIEVFDFCLRRVVGENDA